MQDEGRGELEAAACICSRDPDVARTKYKLLSRHCSATPQVPHPVGVLTSPNNWSSMVQVVELPWVSRLEGGVDWLCWPSCREPPSSAVQDRHLLCRTDSCSVAQHSGFADPQQLCLTPTPTLPQALHVRGVPHEAAAALLDAAPPLELGIWCCGHKDGRARCEVWLALDDGARDFSWLQGAVAAAGAEQPACSMQLPAHLRWLTQSLHTTMPAFVILSHLLTHRLPAASAANR